MFKIFLKFFSILLSCKNCFAILLSLKTVSSYERLRFFFIIKDLRVYVSNQSTFQRNRQQDSKLNSNTKCFMKKIRHHRCFFRLSHLCSYRSFRDFFAHVLRIKRSYYNMITYFLMIVFVLIFKHS